MAPGTVKAGLVIRASMVCLLLRGRAVTPGGLVVVTRLTDRRREECDRWTTTNLLAERVRGAPAAPAGGRLPDARLVAEADDAVQEAWLRLSRTDAGEIENLRRLADHGRRPHLPRHAARRAAPGARSRSTPHVPDPRRRPRRAALDPEHEARAGRRRGPGPAGGARHAAPAERLAFVLHDMFAVPFDEIAPIVDRSPAATRQLASRARRRVQGAAPPRRRPGPAARRWSTPSSPPPAAATSTPCVAVLDPDVVLRSDGDPRGRRPASCVPAPSRWRARR